MEHIISHVSQQINTFSKHSDIAYTPYEVSLPSPADLSQESIRKAINTTLGKTKHEFVMLIGRLFEQYGQAWASLESLSSMMEEKIGKQLKARQMKKISAWFEKQGFGGRLRNHKRDKYHYSMSEMCIAYYHYHRHRIQKSAPQITKKCTSNTKSNTKSTKIKIKEEPGDLDNINKQEKRIDIDFFEQKLIIQITKEASVKEQMVKKWVSQYGSMVINEIFIKSKSYSPDNLGGYMHRILQLTPPVRIDVKRFYECEPDLIPSVDAAVHANKELANMKKILRPWITQGEL